MHAQAITLIVNLWVHARYFLSQQWRILKYEDVKGWVSNKSLDSPVKIFQERSIKPEDLFSSEFQTSVAQEFQEWSSKEEVWSMRWSIKQEVRLSGQTLEKFELLVFYLATSSTKKA